MGKKDRARKQAKLKKQQQAAAAKAKAAAAKAAPNKKTKGKNGKKRVEEKKVYPPLVLAFHVGNTNSRVAYQADDRPDLIAAECGSRLIKSYVTFSVRG